MGTAHNLALLVILVSLTTNCYGLGESCSSVDTTNCTGTGEVCEGSNCVCNSSYYHNADQTECSPKLDLNVQGCTDAGTQCADTNTQCSSGSPSYCQCTSDYYDDTKDTGGTCVHKAELGATCPSVLTVDADQSCLDPNAECVGDDSSTTQYNCQCVATFYDNNVAEARVCTAKVDLDGACTQAFSDSSEPCKTPLAVCTGNGESTFTCQCGGGSSKSDTNACSIVKQLGSSCSSGSTECGNIDNAICTGTCVCDSGYYDTNSGSTIGGSCEKRTLGQSCDNANQCSASNVDCTNDSCKCKSGYYTNQGANTCTKQNLNEACTNTSECSPQYSTCSNSVCACQNGYYSGSNTCTKPSLNGACSADIHCDQVPNSECSSNTNGICRCKSDYKEDARACLKRNLGQSCDRASQCSASNVDCNGDCRCQNGFYSNQGSNTCSKQYLSQPCSADAHCDVVDNSACRSNTCQCKSDYKQDSGQCLKRQISQSCDRKEQCSATNAECSSSFCRCVSGFYFVYPNTCTKRNLDETCDFGNQCSDVFTTCSTTCQCLSDYFDNNDGPGGSCDSKKALDEQCPRLTNSAPCADNFARCSQVSTSQTYTCQCPSSYYDDNGASPGGSCQQKVNLGYTCPSVDACSTANAICSGSSNSGSKCMCGANYYDTNTAQSFGGDCRTKISLFSNCEKTYDIEFQCKDPNANCSKTADCQCNKGYHAETVNNVVQCEANKTLGESCAIASECSDPNAGCLDSKCTCNIEFYDSDSYTVKGGNCFPVSELRVFNIQFTVSTTSLGISWIPPPEGKDQYIDEYTVGWRPKGNSVTGLNKTVVLSPTTLYQLSPGRAYSVTVTSVNKRTRENYLRSTFVTVEQSTEPNPPTDFTLTDDDLDARNKTIQLFWTAPATGVVTEYEIKLLNVDNSSITTVYSSQLNTFVTDSSLLNGFQYNVAIASRSEGYLNMNSQMIYVWSEPLHFGIKTTVQVPDPPTNVVCGETTDIYIPLTWTAPTYPNGSLVQYHIHVYSSQNSLLKVVSTSNIATSAQIGDLEPGTYYNFRVYTENEKYNSSLYGQTSFCKTKPRMSDAPQDLAFTGVTSRAFTVSWRRPNNTYSEEILGYVLQIKEGDSCVQEVNYKCSDCTESFDSAPSSNRACKGGEKTDESKSEAELQTSTLTFSSNAFKPDTDYTILVAAVTGIGWGHQALQSVRSKEEEPQEPPKAVYVSDIGKTSFNVSWSLIGPRPGQVTYTVILIADTGAESKTYTVKGYNKTTLTADGLEEYWFYDVLVTARTNVGGAKTSDTTQKYRTLPSAPGAVTEFEAVTAQKRSDNFHKMTIRWKAPSLLERNSVIKEYVLKHNVGNTTSNSGVAEQWQSLPFESKTGDVFYSQVFDVIPESTYQFEVNAVNIESTDNIGKKMTISEMAPAGFPVSIEEADATLLVVKEGSKDQTFISLNLVREFFTEETNGRVQRTALLGCKSSACPENFLDNADTHEKVDVLANWQKAAQSGLYRITTADWLTKYKRRRRSTYTEVPFTVGTENCDGVTEGTYCNGPLEPETEYIFVAVVCTSTGCTVSNKYGPFITDEAVPQPVGMIVGIVVGVIAILAIAVLVLFILRKHRNKTPTMSRENGVEMENNTDLVSTKDGIRLVVYENVISGNQGELKAAGQNYNTVNISGLWSEKDYKLCFAPTIDNVNQFWTMIFEEEVHTIVMFAESKTPKKELRYWPSDFNEPIKYRHVDLEVTYLNTHDAYTHTKMNICNRGTARTINHYQCSSISTFCPDGFVDFVKCVRSNFKTGRILLHSSEGMASTVPFVVLDTCIQQLSDGALAEKVDVYKMLVNIVKTRKDLMPPQELFIFTHDCVQSLGSCDYAPLQNTAQSESVYQTLEVDD